MWKFKDYDSSVGNLRCGGIKANTRADTWNSLNVVSILDQHLNSWYNIEMTLGWSNLSAQGYFDLQTPHAYRIGL